MAGSTSGSVGGLGHMAILGRYPRLCIPSQVLERFKDLAKDFADPEHFRINIKLGWQKLNDYYGTLSEIPMCYTGLALHPAYRWKWFERNWADPSRAD